MTKTRKLPITVDEFDRLVDDVFDSYSFDDKNHVTVVTAQAICHTSVDCGDISVSAIRDRAIRSLAYRIAERKGKEVRDLSYLGELLKLLESDPNNQQALDEIQKAASEGFIAAKEAYERLTSGED